MEKTIEQWFDMLPEPIRSEALEARRIGSERNPDFYRIGKTTENLHEALDFGFNWEIDGYPYDKWDSIYRRAKSGEFDPKPTATPTDLDAAIATITSMRERIAELEAKLDAVRKAVN